MCLLRQRCRGFRSHPQGEGEGSAWLAEEVAGRQLHRFGRYGALLISDETDVSGIDDALKIYQTSRSHLPALDQLCPEPIPTISTPPEPNLFEEPEGRAAQVIPLETGLRSLSSVSGLECGEESPRESQSKTEKG